MHILFPDTERGCAAVLYLQLSAYIHQGCPQPQEPEKNGCLKEHPFKYLLYLLSLVGFKYMRFEWPLDQAAIKICTEAT